MTRPPTPAPLPLFARLWFAVVCFFQVLFDGVHAARLKEAGGARGELPEAIPSSEQGAAQAPRSASRDEARADRDEAALALLSLLQREGRLIDFLEEDVVGFADADIGAAARVVHDGCRRALREHLTIEAVRSEDEGARVTLADGFDAEQVKLTGDVRGTAPYTGTLRHRGWRVTAMTMPTGVGKHDARIIAQAEVEL